MVGEHYVNSGSPRFDREDTFIFYVQTSENNETPVRLRSFASHVCPNRYAFFIACYECQVSLFFSCSSHYFALVKVFIRLRDILIIHIRSTFKKILSHPYG